MTRDLDLAKICRAIEDSKARSYELIADLSGQQLLGPRLPIVNPLRWELGHIAWFYEKWILRRNGQSSLLAGADALYDSVAVLHNTRWDLVLPSLKRIKRYFEEVSKAVLEKLSSSSSSSEDLYHGLYSVFHQDMHNEAFTITRQVLSYPAPAGLFAGQGLEDLEQGPLTGDVEVAATSFGLGASPRSGFVFDNEKWVQAVDLGAFQISRAPVTQREYLEFVEESGYERQELWSEVGWSWLQEVGAKAPVYWRHRDGCWQQRVFDKWLLLSADKPMVHVCWHEAQAWCRWAGRRLPTEAEWELSASLDTAGGKRRYPWGSQSSGDFANLDGRHGYLVDVAAYKAGESALGCRQMLGNVWEWTEDTFHSFPGFVADPYKEYSEPWFGTRKVLKGGCWVTRGRLIRSTLRNFYAPCRRDIWAGFRTCKGLGKK